MGKKYNIIVGVMLIFILFASVRNYSRLQLGIGPVYYIGGYTLTALSFYTFYKNKLAHSITYIAPVLYVIWALIGIYRGAFEVTSGWIFNQYLHGILSVIVPVCIFLFAFPDTIIRSFQIFNIFAIAYSFISLGWNYSHGAYVYAFPPFYYFYLCFLIKIPRLWKFLTIVATIFVLTCLENRSGCAKVFMSVGLFIIFLFPKLIQNVILNVVHWALYVIPVVLIYLGLTGQYNVFNGKYKGKNVVNRVVVSNEVASHEQNLREDTRTFLYEEVLNSMVVNDYVIAGRTPARGYYSPYFAETEKIIQGKNYGERIASEVGLLNTMHWLGIIGLILLTLVYLQGSCLALYRSNNKYVKCLSVEIAFMWLWSWVENYNIFHLMDVTIYVMLAICYSQFFRKMTDYEFEMWFKSIFRSPFVEFHDYNKFQLAKYWLRMKI